MPRAARQRGREEGSGRGRSIAETSPAGEGERAFFVCRGRAHLRSSPHLRVSPGTEGSPPFLLLTLLSLLHTLPLLPWPPPATRRRPRCQSRPTARRRGARPTAPPTTATGTGGGGMDGCVERCGVHGRVGGEEEEGVGRAGPGRATRVSFFERVTSTCARGAARGARCRGRRVLTEMPPCLNWAQGGRRRRERCVGESARGRDATREMRAKNTPAVQGCCATHPHLQARGVCVAFAAHSERKKGGANWEC